MAEYTACLTGGTEVVLCDDGSGVFRSDNGDLSFGYTGGQWQLFDAPNSTVYTNPFATDPLDPFDGGTQRSFVSDNLEIVVKLGSGSSEEMGSSDEVGSEMSEMGSAKTGSSVSEPSSAVVPWRGAYLALFVVEAPEVRFEDVVRFELTRRQGFVGLDERWLQTVERSTVVIWSALQSDGDAVGVKYDARRGGVNVWARRARGSVVLSVSAVRKGKGGVRFPRRDREQYLANERLIREAFPVIER